MHGTWLCPRREDRQRLLDMEPRLKPVRAATLGILGLALLAAAPWEGWWTLLPLVVAAGGFAAVDRGMQRSERPELWIGSAWLLSQIVIAVSIATIGGPTSESVAWLVIPVVTLSARFTSRGVWAGVAITAVLLVAVTVGVDPASVAADPPQLIFPLALLAAVALLSTARLRSDLEHRPEAILDGLTGMLNRRAMKDRMGELDEQAGQTGAPVGVIIADIDRFKRINDEHGHARGDAVLVEVAATMRTVLRAFDLAYRVGGEEFVVLLPGASRDEAALLAERLRAAVAGTAHAGLDVTVSLGVATTEGDAVADAMLRADTALYAAKAAGRDCVRVAGTLAAAV